MTTDRRDLEVSVEIAITKFARDYMGTEPFKLRVYVMDDVILVRLLGELAPAETMLAKDTAGVNRDRAEFVRDIHSRLIESGKNLLETTVTSAIGVPIMSTLTDISMKTGERVIVFILGEPVLKSGN